MTTKKAPAFKRTKVTTTATHIETLKIEKKGTTKPPFTKEPSHESTFKHEHQPPREQQPSHETPAFKHETREQWLEAAVAAMVPWFAAIATPLPSRIRVSTGFPTGWSRKHLNENRTMGQCWAQNVAADGVNQVFVTPLLDDPIAVLAVLVHELVHAAVGCEVGHRRPFATAAKGIGLVGPMKSTSPSLDLAARLLVLVEEDLGPYPHAKLTPTIRKRQGVRNRLIQCVPCEFKLRGARESLLRVGIPTCPGCGAVMVPDFPLDIDDDASHTAA
ncbi:MAG TPA: hypothetical protein VGF24_33135 [Vicinamibacterales bacterium]|jgi:hypothetical protein